MAPRISLEQWRSLQAVVDAGGYAQAAQALHKSQSAVTYAVQKIERQLGLRLFEIKGRKAELTPGGRLLYRRARGLLEEAGAIESAARTLTAGWESEIALAVEIVFPTWLLLECLAVFAQERPQTRIELYETVLSGTAEALVQNRVSLAIGPVIPAGFVGEPLMTIRFIATAHPDHPLHQLGRELTSEDLRRHRQLVIRDSGTARSGNARWLEAEQRWTFSHKATSIHAAVSGLGFAWFAEDTIRRELEQGLLKPLPLREGAEQLAPLYLIHAGRDQTGRGSLRLAEIIRSRVSNACRSAMAPDSTNMPTRSDVDRRPA
ncbi:MAG: LysR family transcriptional regulator [Steroidobacteraceae bacterium]